MKEVVVNIHEAKTHLSRLINKVQEGDVVVIARSNVPVVKLVPICQGETSRVLGTAEGVVRMLDNFEDALEDFENYV
jgi:prevent-host-death family protein